MGSRICFAANTIILGPATCHGHDPDVKRGGQGSGGKVTDWGVKGHKAQRPRAKSQTKGSGKSRDSLRPVTQFGQKLGRRNRELTGRNWTGKLSPGIRNQD